MYIVLFSLYGAVGDEGCVEDEVVDIVKDCNTHPMETQNEDSCGSEDEMVVVLDNLRVSAEPLLLYCRCLRHMFLH